MKTTLEEIEESLQSSLKKHLPPLQISKEKEGHIEVIGTKEVMQGKQKVKGHYFASTVRKPKDIRLYFFPIYTHVDEYEALSPELQKSLKGKSCFHIKKLSPEMETEIQALIQKGIDLYQRDGLI